MLYTAKSKKVTISADTFGAELHSIKAGKTEYQGSNEIVEGCLGYFLTDVACLSQDLKALFVDCVAQLVGAFHIVAQGGKILCQPKETVEIEGPLKHLLLHLLCQNIEFLKDALGCFRHGAYYGQDLALRGNLHGKEQILLLGIVVGEIAHRSACMFGYGP